MLLKHHKTVDIGLYTVSYINHINVVNVTISTQSSQWGRCEVGIAGNNL